MSSLPHIDNILSRLTHVKPSGKGHEARCPAHDDGRASLSVNVGKEDRALIHCHAGCTTHAIMSSIGLRLADLFPAKTTNGRSHKSTWPTTPIVATYDYADEHGELLYQVCRFDPKDFRQRRPNGRGGWVGGRGSTRSVLYRLPELLASTDTVFVVEGEKDADNARAIGLTATCNVGGASESDKSKWLPEYNASFSGRDVVLIADNDKVHKKTGRKPGLEHAYAAARGISSVAASVRGPIVLPGGKDLSDWLAAGGTADALRQLAQAAPAFDPTATPPRETASDGSMPVDTTAEKMSDINSGSGLVEEDAHRFARFYTDAGNAARFALQHGEYIRYCASWSAWLIYRGGRWERDAKDEITRHALKTALSIFDELKDAADTDQQEKISKWAIKSQSAERLGAMLKLAKSRMGVVAGELDSNRWLLNVRNGTVDLKTGNLQPHRREDFITKICRASYIPNAPAPIFNAFMARIFRAHPELIAYMAKAIGYSASGSIEEQAFFFLYGEGGNGKTTLLDIGTYVLGDYAGKADRELLIANERGASHPTGMADLQGRRLVVCSETNEGSRLDEAKLKDLVGEGTIKARFMFADFFEFPNTHKVFLYSNHRPVVRGTDHGFWRRMKLIPFIEKIIETEKDGSLPRKLESEADGVLAWIVAGCLAWQSEGLGLPDEIAKATNDYRVEMDSVGTFISECCEIEGGEITAKDLYAAYKKFCEQRGEYTLTQTMLGRKLANRPGLRRGKNSYSSCVVWFGISLKIREEKSPENHEEPPF